MDSPDPRHLARYIVVCADRCVRHSGTFTSESQAVWWSQHPGCCAMGDHKVVRATAWEAAA